MKFLVIDDSSTMRKIVGLALSGSGHSYVEAENGQEGLAAARGAAFDCIMLDVNMPVMTGLEFLAERAKDPALKKVPVVILTTQSEESLKAEAKRLGAEAFLEKPFQKENLLKTISELMGS